MAATVTPVPINHASLKAKLAGFQVQKDQAIANANAITGAMQLLETMLQELGPESVTPPVPPIEKKTK